MTLKGVFFLLGQYIYGGNCYFVNGPTLSRGHFGTKRPEAAGSVPTPEYAAIVGAPAKPHGFVGRGGAAERVSFAACGETSDTQLATTRQETFSGRTAMESKMEGTHER